MTDTIAPATPGLAELLTRQTIAVFTDHWGKMLSTVLTAAATYMATSIMTPPPWPAPKVDIVKTVPDAGSLMQRVTAIESLLAYDHCTNAVHVLRAEMAQKFERRAGKKVVGVPASAK